MLLQSWSDPAKDQAGPIRVFPALPSAWKDVEFRDLRAEGAFLVSAKRSNGKTQWVRIKSLAGEPCFVKHGIEGPLRIEGSHTQTLEPSTTGIHRIELQKGGEVLLISGT
jgi:hypothetical protein